MEKNMPVRIEFSHWIHHTAVIFAGLDIATAGLCITEKVYIILRLKKYVGYVGAYMEI